MNQRRNFHLKWCIAFSPPQQAAAYCVEGTPSAFKNHAHEVCSLFQCCCRSSLLLLELHYHWPGLTSYISVCPGCSGKCILVLGCPCHKGTHWCVTGWTHRDDVTGGGNGPFSAWWSPSAVIMPNIEGCPFQSSPCGDFQCLDGTIKHTKYPPPPLQEKKKEKRSEWCHPSSSPNCWIALSALQGSSSVMCTRRFWFSARRSACSEIPELAASEIMATSCRNQTTTSNHLWKSNHNVKSSVEIKLPLHTICGNQTTTSQHLWKSNHHLSVKIKPLLHTICGNQCTASNYLWKSNHTFKLSLKIKPHLQTTSGNQTPPNRLWESNHSFKLSLESNHTFKPSLKTKHHL